MIRSIVAKPPFWVSDFTTNTFFDDPGFPQWASSVQWVTLGMMPYPVWIFVTSHRSGVLKARSRLHLKAVSIWTEILVSMVGRGTAFKLAETDLINEVMGIEKRSRFRLFGYICCPIGPVFQWIESQIPILRM